VLDEVNLTVTEGEFLCIVGFSGSGKTTLISLLSGLLKPDAGEVLLRGVPVRGPGLDRGIVFQNYSLLPWLSAADNVALAVHQRFPDLSRTQRAARVRHYLEMVSLGHAADRKPGQLSGGMRQRVSVARALALDPEILLLDEPLSALDALTRGTLQTEIADLWQRQRKTVVLITNDVDEALLLGDRIIPLTHGPNATLGPAFAVPLARPRRHEILTNDPAARHLRAEIFANLTATSQASASQGEVVALPDLKPYDVERHRLTA
jgi:nitrate/nitrite transport system ATP-binding protein